MKLLIFLVLIIPLVALLGCSTEALEQSVNLTAWHEHRRQKRFLIYQNGGVVKVVTGVALPSAEFPDKRFWRQLVWLMNFHYQFSEPTSPIYWWNKFGSSRAGMQGPVELTPSEDDEVAAPLVDEPQQFLYDFAVQYLKQNGMNGEACMARLICDNAQVHEHDGLFAELLHRVLIPHESLSDKYIDAYRMGQQGVDCRETFPDAAAHDCILDRFLHVFDRKMGQSFVRT